jgi:arylsulfatase A-like enzyme
MKVLVLNVRGLHLGYAGCYGTEWMDTPHLDRVAAEGVVFDQHFADCPGLTGAARTCWTGRYHFPVAQSHDSQDSEDLPSLARFLEAQNIAFVQVDESGLSKPTDDGEIPVGEETLPAILTALNQLASEERWFLWVDWPALCPPWQVSEEFLHRYFGEEADEEEEPLAPWTDPPVGPLDLTDDTTLERLQNTYAAAVTDMDSQLGLLLEELEQRGLADEVLLCVTSDRGLALGEHGVVGDCRPWLHEEVIHLPLIIRLPGGAEAGRRIFALTQPVDLLPTFLEAFALPVPSSVQGHSAWPLLRGKSEQVRAYACTGMRLGNNTEWAIRTSEWGFILPESHVEPGPLRGPQLYVKPDDRWEVNNVLQHHLDLADHLLQTLRGFVAASRRPGPLQAPALGDVEAEHVPVELNKPENSTHSGV